MQPHLYPSDTAKIAFIISQLSGKALKWADSIWSQQGAVTQSYSSFISHFREVFGKPITDSSAGEKLYNLRQGSMSIYDYALQFRTLAALSGWNEQALITNYRQGLEPRVRLQLAACEDNIGLEKFIQLSIRCATRMQACLQEHQVQFFSTVPLCPSEPVSTPEPAQEPMDVENSRLSYEERRRCLTHRLCLYCGEPGHVIAACPTRPPRPLVSAIIPATRKMKPLTTAVNITAANVSLTVVALIDLGSAGNFISGALCRQLRIKTSPSPTIYKICSITGRPLSRKRVRSVAGPVNIQSFFFVAKKDGGLRPCIDYRALNKITVKFRYPLPLVPAALEHLRGATVFTKLDLRSAYNLIRIREGDEWKTAFITPTGHYEYLVMPYGLVNAPSVFQDFIHEVLREFLHRFVLVYIDDILIYSRSQAEHRQHVAEVLTRLRQYHLFLKAEKCTFHQPSVSFLGYNIDHSGIRMDERKVESITNWPEPTTIKELQRFLGFSNFYRRFIKGYSSIAHPLTSLLRNQPKSLSWTPAATNAFNQLKEAFTTAPLLVHPDPEKQFIVEVDASTTGVGAVLSQQQGSARRKSTIPSETGNF
ncbi:uncharacterized protein LOC125264212 [Megalobrama amblycephala]|uniref:uncharacterized protein LOC125264212 n=1 Tax=Megalobrama amblycephala TaxID=75352 RepID=UPI002013ECA2|nr:uncharacterized protein LOC125264212 [Megalobrama amblycephala]